MNRIRIKVLLATLLATLVIAGNSANAQVKPFKIVGAGIAPDGIPLPGQDPRSHWSIGNATHLGKYSGLGAVQTDTNNLVFHSDGSITGEFGSAIPFAFEGANGDVLACHYGRTAFGAQNPGTFELVPTGDPGVYVAYWVAEFVPYLPDCTGKFAGIEGSWIMYASSEPFQLGGTDPVGYSWEGQGSLKFKQGK
jgi:hypothetical protein